jgi:hypothetical protein
MVYDGASLMKVASSIFLTFFCAEIVCLSATYLDTWYKRDTNALLGITYGDGLFVAVGRQGKILTSRNGQNWAAQDSGVTADLNAATHGIIRWPSPHGVFVAVGTYPFVITSTNGTNWVQQNVPWSHELNDIAHSDGIFIAVATRSYPDDPNAVVSFDGREWFEQSFFYPTNCLGSLDGLHAIAFGNGHFVAVGHICYPIFTATFGIEDWVPRGNYYNEHFRGIAFGNNLTRFYRTETR